MAENGNLYKNFIEMIHGFKTKKLILDLIKIIIRSNIIYE